VFGERGEAGMRLIVSMTLVAALAWVIPMVFFGRQQARRASDLAGASEEAQEAVASGQAPVDPIGRAVDVQAQAQLNESIRVAQVFFAESGTYDGFGPSVAAEYAPNVTFTTAAAAPGIVSIRGVTSTTVVLVTAVEDAAYLCAAADMDLVSFGRSNAQTPAQCTGGWE